MTYSLKDNSKYKEWFEGNDSVSFENCLLNRGDFGRFLADYLVSEKDGFVLNIDSPWGTGKTEFLKRLYVELITRKYPCVYIDAWESDFSEAPLKVVASELVSQLELFNEDIGKLDGRDKLKDGFSKFLKTSAILSTGVASGLLKSYGLPIDSSMLTDAMIVGADTSDSTELQKLLTDHQEQIQAIRTIRESLSQLAETLASVRGLKVPVVVLIDELDRCRPNYSVELLEVVKHFFATENLVFVIASDTEQLESSIKVLYGETFDSKRYLKRFFDRVATLPEPDIGHYLKIHNLEKLDDSRQIMLYPIKAVFKMSGLSLFELPFLWCTQLFNLKIRDIDQVIQKVKACLQVLSQRNQGKIIAVNLIVLVAAVCESHLGLTSYTQRSSKAGKDDSPSEHKYGNHSVQPSLPKDLRCIYQLSFNMVKTHKRKGEFQEEIEGLVHYEVVRQAFITNSSKSNLDITIEDQYRSICSQLDSQGSNIQMLLWSDYKQLIDLAGYIS
ncbi:P-loop NTPase fold protein [Litoribrevibacter euphylliae]|uniref:P-loop NTPase fold protein n=1 Tax=Litoribrevibacter euphylliae TaxID=1834034 RepID=A0ABV7HHP4_9GAMM